jgi:hypothetical protein
MSWFRRRPRIKEPEKLTPHHSSPFARKAMEEAKELAKPIKKTPAKPK